MKAARWSFTGLKQAETCLRQFHEVRVLKNYPYEATSDEAVWGRYVHKAFEDRQAVHKELPQDLSQHEPFMQRLEGWEGFFFTEQKVALDKQLKPINFFGGDAVWWSGIIDYTKIHNGEHRGRIVDYKTGKRRPEPDQLIQNVLWGFAMYPEINIFDCMFYWTQAQERADQPSDGAVDRYVYSRDQIPELWSRFVAPLGRLFEAYKTDTWPAKPNGLCHGYCPHVKCEHWKPKREKR